jgi:hypothetical protein
VTAAGLAAAICLNQDETGWHVPSRKGSKDRKVALLRDW